MIDEDSIEYKNRSRQAPQGSGMQRPVRAPALRQQGLNRTTAGRQGAHLDQRCNRQPKYNAYNFESSKYRGKRGRMAKGSHLEYGKRRGERATLAAGAFTSGYSPTECGTM